MQSNEPDLINSQLILNLPAYKGSSAQLSSKHIPIPDFVSVGLDVVGATDGAFVGVEVGATVDVESDWITLSVQRPQAFGHRKLSSFVSDGVNPRSANPSQLRPACRIALQVNPILDR